VFGVCDGFGEQRSDVLVVRLVDRLATLAFADDQFAVAQQAQLLGDDRLFHSTARASSLTEHGPLSGG
jgi:hypothetical protein